MCIRDSKKWTDIVGKGEAASKVKESGFFDPLFKGKEPVSYTHLDVYKRQRLNRVTVRQQLQLLQRVGMSALTEEMQNYLLYTSRCV